MERTLIIFKPDSNNFKIKNDLTYAFNKYNLEIVGKEKIKLDEVQVFSIWKHCADDYVLRQLLLKYVCGKQLSVVYVAGNKVTEKTYIIKRFIRNKYGKSYYSNCLHMPDDQTEFLYNYSVMHKTNSALKRETTMGKNNFNLSKQEMDYLTNRLWRKIYKKNIKKAIKNKINTLIRKKQNFLLIRLNGETNIINVIKLLNTILGKNKLFDAYYATLICVELGKYPLYEKGNYKEMVICSQIVENMGIECDIYIGGVIV